MDVWLKSIPGGRHLVPVEDVQSSLCRDDRLHAIYREKWENQNLDCEGGG
jgi:hypothetical protein